MMVSLQPIPAVLQQVEPLTPGNHLFFFRPTEPIAIAPGQFVEISVPGIGAFPVSACDLVRSGCIVSCIRKAGRVTDALFGLQSGARLGIRGPFGNGFDLERLRGRDVLLMAGGLGMAPLRALLHALLDHGWPQRVILLYGARNGRELLFRDELVRLAKANAIELCFSVDLDEGKNSVPAAIPCRVGLVSDLLDGLPLSVGMTASVVSGPPALYGGVLEKLAALGLPPGHIYATLERRMRCGIGECCHCVTGGVFICEEGPVFSLSQLRNMEGAV